MLIHSYENGQRTKNSVVKNVKKTTEIHPFGPNFGAMVSVFPFKTDGREGKDRIRVTILIKRYDTYKGRHFFFGESSLTLNQSELSELNAYATKIFESQGINWEMEAVKIDDDDETEEDSDEGEMYDPMEGTSRGKKVHQKREKKVKKNEKKKKRKNSFEFESKISSCSEDVSSDEDDSEKSLKRRKRE